MSKLLIFFKIWNLAELWAKLSHSFRYQVAFSDSVNIIRHTCTFGKKWHLQWLNTWSLLWVASWICALYSVKSLHLSRGFIFALLINIAKALFWPFPHSALPKAATAGLGCVSVGYKGGKGNQSFMGSLGILAVS